MSFYSIEQVSPYITEVQQYDHIEECPDDFLSEDELIEALGGRRILYTGTVIHHNLVDEDLQRLYEQAKHNNKKSFVLPDDLLSILTEEYSYQSKRAHPYCSRRGNKMHLLDEVTLKAKADAKKQKSQHQNVAYALVWNIVRAYNKTVKFELSLGYINRDPKGALRMMKQLVPSFDDLDVSKESGSEIYREFWTDFESIDF